MFNKCMQLLRHTIWEGGSYVLLHDEEVHGGKKLIWQQLRYDDRIGATIRSMHRACVSG